MAQEKEYTGSFTRRRYQHLRMILKVNLSILKTSSLITKEEIVKRNKTIYWRNNAGSTSAFSNKKLTVKRVL